MEDTRIPVGIVLIPSYFHIYFLFAIYSSTLTDQISDYKFKPILIWLKDVHVLFFSFVLHISMETYILIYYHAKLDSNAQRWCLMSWPFSDLPLLLVTEGHTCT